MCRPGYGRGMTDIERDDELIAERSHLLPEEEAAGSDNPQRQAEAILEESDERVEQPEETRRDSSQTPGP
jgi:hypothetical protein